MMLEKEPKVHSYETAGRRSIKDKAVYALSDLVFQQIFFRNYRGILSRFEAQSDDNLLKKESAQLEKAWQKAMTDFRSFAPQIEALRSVCERTNNVFEFSADSYLKQIKGCFPQVRSVTARLFLTDMLFVRAAGDVKRFNSQDDYLIGAANLMHDLIGVAELSDDAVVDISLNEIVGAVLEKKIT